MASRRTATTRRKVAVGTLSLLGVVAALMLVNASSASAGPPCIPRDPESGPWCPPPPPPPPPEPDCPLDPPPGLICKPGPSATFAFVGADANGNARHCEVTLFGATPPDQNGGEAIQFRTRNICSGGMRNVTLDTRLVNTLQTTIANGPQGYCHEFVTGAGCGTAVLSSTGGIGGQPAGEYTQIATVRLALREGSLDPWVVVEGTTPAGSAETCTPGTYVTRCELRLPITADGI
jgi:hypothetical protein